MKYLYLFLFLLLPGCCFAAEEVDLSNPYVVNPSSATFFKVERLVLDIKLSDIKIQLGDGHISKTFEYQGPIALNMIIALNKTNLSTNSLQKRIMTQLISDGFISGTISGSPD